MLDMVEQQYIKYLYEEEGKSLNEITRMTGHNYRTVQRYARKEDWNEEERREVKPESYPVLKDSAEMFCFSRKISVLSTLGQCNCNDF